MNRKKDDKKRRSPKAHHPAEQHNERLEPSEVKNIEHNPRIANNSGNNFGLKWFPQNKAR